MPPLNTSKSPVALNGHKSFLSRLLESWRPTSEQKLEQAETNILANLQSNFSNSFVPVSSHAVVRTVSLESETLSQSSIPLVMIHGFGAGLLQFHKNLDYLHSKRSVHALDLPGFGRSTRTVFPTGPQEVEKVFVDTLEVWRKAMGLQQFVLLGHSFGAYIACAYSLRYPSRVRHLILVDPWGFGEPPNEQELKDKFKQSSWLWRAVGHLKPFTLVRAAGPWGPDVVKRMRADLVATFGDGFLDYIYHCNVQKPTGEMAYYSMQHCFAWAKRPMLSRLRKELSPAVPLTVVSGGRSWLGRVEDNTAHKLTMARQSDSFVAVHSVEGAGHHVHADRPTEFNNIITNTLELIDSGQDSATVV